MADEMQKPVSISPDVIMVIPRSEVVGGKESTRKKIAEHKSAPTPGRIQLDQDVEVHVKINDVDERREGEALVTKATSLARKYCTASPLGYLTGRDRLIELQGEMDKLKVEAGEFNGRSKFSKVKIASSYLPIATAIGPEDARVLADHVRQTLEEAREALESGDSAKIAAILLPAKCGNLHMWAVGSQRDAIKIAVEDIRGAKRAIAEQVKAMSESRESAGKSIVASARCDALRAAIELFTYEEERAELPAGDPPAPALPAGALAA